MTVDGRNVKVGPHDYPSGYLTRALLPRNKIKKANRISKVGWKKDGGRFDGLVMCVVGGLRLVVAFIEEFPPINRDQWRSLLQYTT